MDIEKILEENRITKEELEIILKSRENSPRILNVNYKDNFDSVTTIGVFSDCHVGHIAFDEKLFNFMAKTMNEKKVSRIYNLGDIVQEMNPKKVNLDELSIIGWRNQVEYAARLLKKFKGIPIFGINGNEDDWHLFKKTGSANIGEELHERVCNYHHLGSESAKIEMREGLTLQLFHPDDNVAYADTYKLQKRIESLSGGEKPDIFLEGHYFKKNDVYRRGIYAFDCGALCGQTKKMMGKNNSAAKGFTIIQVEIGEDGLERVVPKFYPGYN